MSAPVALDDSYRAGMMSLKVEIAHSRRGAIGQNPSLGAALLFARHPGFFPRSQCRALVGARRRIRDHHGVEGRRRRGGVTTFEKCYGEHSREHGRVEPSRYAYVPPRVPISGEQDHAVRTMLAQYSRHNCVAGELGSCHGR